VFAAAGVFGSPGTRQGVRDSAHADHQSALIRRVRGHNGYCRGEARFLISGQEVWRVSRVAIPRHPDDMSIVGAGSGSFGDEDAVRIAQWEAAWALRQPPPNEVPGAAPVEALLASTETTAVYICGAAVYRNGMEFSVQVLWRGGDEDTDDLMDPLWGTGGSPQLLFGVEFADGRRCSNLRSHTGLEPHCQDEDQPYLHGEGGGGDGNRSSMGLFLTPLPPPGDLTVVCAWPDKDIPETTIRLPTEGIRAAASRVHQLWPDVPQHHTVRPPRPPNVPEGGWFAAELDDPPTA
jgi:hypothetical protein